MPVSLSQLVSDSGIVALTFRQELQAVDGPDIPIFPPTYPTPKDGWKHKFDTPYTVNETTDGVRVCDLDSVQSQANRMEAVFTTDLADVVPQLAVQAGTRPPVPLTELPHRIVDAAIRATDLSDDIRSWMEAADSGDPEPLARVAPTSFVYGVWDSRDTQVRLPRVIRSEIRAYDVSVFTRSKLYSGAFPRESLGIDEKVWGKKTGGKMAAAEVGFGPAPSINAHGGILVHGKIVHSASVLLNVLRKYRTADGSDLLPTYLLGLALGGLLLSARDYTLRSGCILVPAGAAEWQSVETTGERTPVGISESAVIEQLREVARDWAEVADIDLGGEPEIHHYDPERGIAMYGPA